jgi:hypothetical protein
MIEKILNNCMGGNLYNALASKGQFSITIDPNLNAGGSYNNDNITLRDFDSDILFHEMFHAYQDNTSSGDMNINSDIEAYIAQYRYLKQIAESDLGAQRQLERYEYGFYAIIKSMSEIAISPNGTSLLVDPIQFEQRYLGAAIYLQNDYKNKNVDIEIDSFSSFDQNFKNLQQLSKGC